MDVMKLAIATMITASALVAQSTPVQGLLQIGAEKIDLRHGYARRVADPFDKQKDAVRVWITNAPLPATDESDIRAAVRAGKIRGVQFDIMAGSSSVNWMVLDKEAMFSTSESGTGVTFKFAGDRVSGAYAMAQPKKVFGSEFFLRTTIDLPVQPRIVNVEPTAADAGAAARSPISQAYLAYHKALLAKNTAALTGMVTPERAAMMKAPDFARSLDLIVSMAPKNPQPLKVTETADAATLLVRAATQRGTVRMKKMSGKWLVESERWTNAE
jgi:hypothetical protein